MTFLMWFKDLCEIVDPGLTKINLRSYFIYQNIYIENDKYCFDLICYKSGPQTREIWERLLDHPPF